MKETTQSVEFRVAWLQREKAWIQASVQRKFL